LQQFKRQLPGSNEAQKRTVLNGAYEAAMDRIMNQKPGFRQLAEKALSWITFAKEPLTKSELQHALAVRTGDLKFDEDNLEQIERVVSVCAGLVTVDEESDIIRLVHYTTQEYFEQTRKDWFPNAEIYIAETCVTYVAFQAFESGSCPTDKEFEDRLADYKLYGYASWYLGYHAGKIPALNEKVLDFLSSKTKVEAVIQARCVQLNYKAEGCQNFPKNSTGLHCAIMYGLDEAISLYPNFDKDMEAKDSFGRTPLILAAKYGNMTSLEMLVKAGRFDINSKDTTGSTPLSLAAEMRDVKVFERLLSIDNVDVNSKDDDGVTPLSKAIMNMMTPMVEQLLKANNLDINSKDNNGCTPLWHAIWDTLPPWREQIVQLLLARPEIDLNSKDIRTSTTPFLLAVDSEDLALVKLFLLGSDDLDVNATDKAGRTPLLNATAYQNSDMVELLLQFDRMAIDSVDRSGLSSLGYAVAHGYEDIVKLLVGTKKANISLEDNDGHTPLWHAQNGKSDTILKIIEQALGS
jgi:ankyrin repeat protein